MNHNLISDYKTPLLFAIVLLAGMFLGYKMSDSLHVTKTSEKPIQLDDLVSLLQKNYVDSLNQDSLYQGGVEGILKMLDPHTVYIPQDQLTQSNEELEGSFYGIGVEFYVSKDTVRIASIMPDGPSANKGMVPGDRLIKVNNQFVTGDSIAFEDVVKKVRGQNNSKVILNLLHPDNTAYQIDINRAMVSYQTVPVSIMLNNQTGYISISMFSETTYDEFKKALNALKNQGLKKLIIDVRDNPGGYMDAVTNIADELIAGKSLLVSTKGHGEETKIYSEREGLFEQGKLAVLVDENSASASEILAGITQDLDRGIVIGRRSFGKGLVQEQFDLTGQGAIRITTARYYLPSGRCIQKDFTKGKSAYEEDLWNRYKNGEYHHRQDSITQKEPIFYTFKKRKVYGGSGITPEHFVALDTTTIISSNAFYEQHIAEEFASRFCFFYPQEIKTWKNITTLDSQINQSHTLLREFKNYLSLNKIPYQAAMLKDVKIQLAKLLFHHNGKGFLLSKSDPAILKAMEVLH